MEADDTMSVSEAALDLGYSKGQAYALVKSGGLDSFKDADTGRLRVSRAAVEHFREHPPPGTRPRFRSGGASPVEMADLARRLSRVEASYADLTGLTERMDRLEQATVGSAVFGADEWRRRAHAVRDSLAEVAAIGALYESAFDLLAEAGDLDAQSRQRRAAADAAMTEARRAWQAAVTAFTTPDDPADVARAPHGR